jgi:hypothetical protein
MRTVEVGYREKYMQLFHVIKIPVELSDPAHAPETDAAANAVVGVPASFADWLSQPAPTIAGPTTAADSGQGIFFCMLGNYLFDTSGGQRPPPGNQ